MLRWQAPYAVIAVAGATFFYNLETGPLADWDEAIYAEVAREIWGSGDWVILHWNYTFEPVVDVGDYAYGRISRAQR